MLGRSELSIWSALREGLKSMVLSMCQDFKRRTNSRSPTSIAKRRLRLGPSIDNLNQNLMRFSKLSRNATAPDHVKMAPFRGRGGRARGGRGGKTSRGGGNGRLARSGIKTKSGYRKFDSQRVKDVDSDSETGPHEVEEVSDVEPEDLSEEDEEEAAPAVKAYNTLIASFAQPQDEDGRRRKRRKVEGDEPNTNGESALEAEEVELQTLQDDDEEEERDEALADELANGLEDEEDAADPFEVHFASPDDNELSRRLKSIQATEWKYEKQDLGNIGTAMVSAPECVEGSVLRKSTVKTVGGLPLKNRIQTATRKIMEGLDNTQQALAPYMFNYQDLMAGDRTPQNANSLRNIISLHAINHILKGRDKVLKNNARLLHASDDLDARDQGFTRPKVLILLETRQMCSKYAEAIISLFSPDQQENKQRFQSSFTAPPDPSSTMPEDFRELFEGNNDNNFLVGLKFTRKTIKFFSAFYNSDIILASPLGLRRIIENEDPKKRDYDFLSSIEIAVVDQLDAMQMQSWENVEVVFNHLNLQLREAHGCDFSRVRNYYLDGNARYLRQTLVFGGYITPEMNRLFNSSMLNVAGKVKIAPTYAGAIANVGGLGVKQTFSRFDCSSPLADPDARFNYFTTAVLPSLLRLPKPSDGAQGILIFVPSYFDFLRVRNFFATSTLTQNTSFGAIHDYSAPPEQRRARSHFLTGRHSILLYSQRAHHFFRLRIKGVKRVVMYGLPDNPIFYEEMVEGYLGTSLEEGRASAEACSSRAMFSKWDGLRLERVAGSERVKGMLGGRGDTFDFV